MCDCCGKHASSEGPKIIVLQPKKKPEDKPEAEVAEE